jgi:hypothetical protein
LVLDRAEDRQHERQLEQQQQELQRAQQTREWHLRRRAELTDLARKYQKLDAELDVMMKTVGGYRSSMYRKVVFSKKRYNN